MRILARHEAHRLGYVATPLLQDIQTMVNNFRLHNGLIAPQDTAQWILSRGLTEEAFMRIMYDLVVVKNLEQIYDTEIEQEVQDHTLFATHFETPKKELLFKKGEVNLRNSWLQINVALERKEGDALPCARALFKQLFPLINELRYHKVIDTFFFMRKPPDLRLRFLVNDPEGSILTQLEHILSKLKDNGFVKYFFPSIYEPEIHQFGGIEAMDFVHAYFETDSIAWILLDELAALDQRTISTDTLVLAVMNDLFFRTLECSSEVWDVWCNLANLIPLSQERPSETNALLLESILPYVSNEERNILLDYIDANQKLSAGLLHIQRDGKLEYGLRAIFPFIATFHFNRHGLNYERQSILAGAMKKAWNPKHSMIGVDTDSFLRDT